MGTYFAKGNPHILSVYSTSFIFGVPSSFFPITVYLRVLASGRIPISNENAPTFNASFIAIRDSSWNQVMSAIVAKAWSMSGALFVPSSVNHLTAKATGFSVRVDMNTSIKERISPKAIFDCHFFRLARISRSVTPIW